MLDEKYGGQMLSAEQAKSKKEVVKLEGLWKDVPFDISDEDIRQLRRNFTQQLQRRLERKE